MGGREGENICRQIVAIINHKPLPYLNSTLLDVHKSNILHFLWRTQHNSSSSFFTESKIQKFPLFNITYCERSASYVYYEIKKERCQMANFWRFSMTFVLVFFRVGLLSFSLNSIWPQMLIVIWSCGLKGLLSRVEWKQDIWEAT